MEQLGERMLNLTESYILILKKSAEKEKTKERLGFPDVALFGKEDDLSFLFSGTLLFGHLSWF